MRKYNYFDDEPEVSQSNKKLVTIDDVKRVAKSAKSRVKKATHGKTLENIKAIIEPEYVRSASLKLLAGVLFVIFVIVFILVFSHTISSQNKKSHQYSVDAGKVCTDYITEYGTVKWETMDSDTYGDGMARLTGLCYARQMDFDNDGSDELMLVYNNKNVYTLEVWSYVSKEFTKVYSQEANSTENATDGSWVGFYHKNNKYYICKSEKDNPQEVTLYALKGDTFKETSTCDYDYENNIYSVKGKINAQDFETIKLSVIKSTRAETIVDTVTANLENFSNVNVVDVLASKTDEQLKADAYYAIVEDRNEKYGKASTASESGKGYIDGVGLVRLIDFNNDGNEEMLIVYRKNVKKSTTNSYSGESIIVEEPTYCLEVYNWNGTVAKKIFSTDSISNLMEDNDTYYVMLKKTDKEVEICINSYDYQSQYTYTASSKIYRMSDESFESIFSARLESEYGYRSYYIDNEYTYQSTFEDKAYSVPMFLNDDGSYDEEQYTVIYLAGDGSEKYTTVINDTVKVIESLNKNYVAED